MVVSGFYDCVAALLKYRSYQNFFSDIALQILHFYEYFERKNPVHGYLKYEKNI